MNTDAFLRLAVGASSKVIYIQLVLKVRDIGIEVDFAETQMPAEGEIGS